MDEATESTELYAWGNASQGQLGSEAESLQFLPIPVHFTLRIRAMACGAEHTLMLTEGNWVYVLGSSADGRLGIGEVAGKCVRVPTLLKDLSELPVCAVACGAAHSVAITSDGQGYSWGKGDCGALGRGSSNSERTPQPIKLPAHLRLRQVSCGSRHTALLAITPESKGILLTCGSGDSGQLGTGLRTAQLAVAVNTEAEVKQVSCGVVHTAYTTYGGKVYAMGGNSLGQLGTGNKVSARFPTKVRSLEGVCVEKVACGSHTAALSTKGELYIWGSGPFGEKLFPCRVTTSVPFRDVEMGSGFGAALDVSRRVWTWGSNAAGELGLGDFKPRKAPVLVTMLGSRAVRGLACGNDFVVALAGEGAARPVKTPGRDQSPYSRQSVLPTKLRPFSEIQSPMSLKTVDSPLNRQLPPFKSPVFLFSPSTEPAALPETQAAEQSFEHPQRFIYLDRLSTETDAKRTESDKSTEDLADLRVKLAAFESSIVTQSARIGYLEKEIALRNEREKESEKRNFLLKKENSDLQRQLAGKGEELEAAVGARKHLQTSFDHLNASNQRLLAQLEEVKAENQSLYRRIADLQPGEMSTSSSKSPLASFQGPPLAKKPTKPPKLALELISKANSKKERTLKLLSQQTPPKSPCFSPACQEDLNTRYIDTEASLPQPPSPQRQSYQSITSATSQDYPKPTPISVIHSPLRTPLTDRGLERPSLQPKLRNKVLDLKGRLKALRDNRPALESKLSAFEKRLRGTQERK